MAFPANIGSGRVVGRFIFGVVDGPDGDEEPDLIPARGTITFTPSVSYMTNISAAGEATVFAPTAVDGILDDEGYLCTPDPADKAVAGYRGVRLFATDDPDLSVNNWTWSVTYRLAAGVGHSVTIPSHSTPILEGGVHDLATLVKTPSSPGVGIPQYEAAVLRAEAAAQSVVDRADAGDFDGGPGPQGDPGNATIRVDNTVGERIFVSDGATEHMVSGDTDWRNIRGLLSDTDVAAGGTAEIRRTGNAVELNLYDCRTTTAGTLTLIEAITIGSGFWPREKAAFSISVGNVNREAIVFANGRVRVYSIATTERVRASIMWTTAQPWPTTLPGTPT